MATRLKKLSPLVQVAVFCASVEANLKAVAELKIEQLENWLDEQRGDINFVGDGSITALQFDRWLAQGGLDEASLADIGLYWVLVNRVPPEIRPVP